MALASDATAKDLFDGADFDESEPDRELAQVCLECVCVCGSAVLAGPPCHAPRPGIRLRV